MALGKSAYRQNKSLLKGLSLLAEMNRSANASCMIADLAKATGIHRTTVKRLLETLKEAGYVEHDVVTNLYRLTFRVQQLSYGYRDTTRITEVAWPHMRSFSQKMVWPCSLVAPEGDEMVVRISTRPYSRLSFHPGMPGRRLPVLTTAAGRAYLAYASEASRETILNMLEGRSALVTGTSLKNSEFIQTLLEQTRERGYALNQGEWEDEPKFSAFAMPICNENKEAIVSLNVVFLTSALKDKNRQEELLHEFAETVKKIEFDYFNQTVDKTE
ncbi:MAG: IclR family transcriptional regulator C-terminal domain-containing protein [Advenella sp.]|nr:IclR family transcriptional regulator C-terminal domain-containing protein [Advenella sp.]